ncbi:MAG: transposase [Moraxellaceae bacterium]|nr:transposase [Moraxellaceae bacterium]
MPLPRSTLSSWVGLVGYALGELVERLVKMLLQRAVLHADETPVQQLDPKAKLSGTKKAYLWAYRSNSLDSQDPIVVFDYQGNREGRHVRAFLGIGKGIWWWMIMWAIKPCLRPQTRRASDCERKWAVGRIYGVSFLRCMLKPNTR